MYLEKSKLLVFNCTSGITGASMGSKSVFSSQDITPNDKRNNAMYL